MESIIRSIFKAFTEIFSSGSIREPSVLHALRLATRISAFGVCNASYQLFRTIMVLDNLTDQHWEATRLAVYAAFRDYRHMADRGEPKEILKFLDYHVGLQGAKEDHGLYIDSALGSLARSHGLGPDPLTFECVRDFNWTSPSFVRGLRSVMRPFRPVRFQGSALALVALLSDSWFNCSVPVMEPEEMSEFCEHIATFMDCVDYRSDAKEMGVTILFGMLRSPEWRKHIVTRFWRVLAYYTQIRYTESVVWCLQNATELLKITRELHGCEGSKWWYGTLWFCYDKLDTTARDEVKRVAAEMLRDDGLSDLNTYLNLMQEELTRIRREINEFSDKWGQLPICRNLQARLITAGGNYDQLARIIGKR